MKTFFLVFSSFGDETTSLCRKVGHLLPSDAETTTVETSGTCRPVTRRKPLSKRRAPVVEWRGDNQSCVETSGTYRPLRRRQPLSERRAPVTQWRGDNHCLNVGHLSLSDAETTTVETSGTYLPVTRRQLLETSVTCRPVTRRQPLSKRRVPITQWRGDNRSCVETSGICRPVTRRQPVLCRNVGHLSPSDAETTSLGSKRRISVVQWRGNNQSCVETSDTCRPLTRRNVPVDRRRNCASAKA